MPSFSEAARSAAYLAVRISVGEAGALLASTWRPTQTLWPAPIVLAQPAPVHVIEVLTWTVHVIPHALVTAVTVGSDQVTLQALAPVALLTWKSAT
jgi:hypothetical protein